MYSKKVDRHTWDSLEKGDVIHTRAGDFEVHRVESGSYPLKDGESKRRVFRIENSKYEAMQWGHYLLEGAYVTVHSSNPLTFSEDPFHKAMQTVLDRVEVLEVFRSLEHEDGVEVEALYMPSNQELHMTITRDKGLPEPVYLDWFVGGPEWDVHLVTGIEKNPSGWPMGSIIEAHLLGFYLDVYQGKHIEVELAYKAGSNYMPYYRVWIRPMSETDRRLAYIKKATGSD